jgi:Domain of unknown function (DUF5668)/B-box zinc finger
MNCANHPERERVAFCQNCGKPLCSECTRVVGSAVFCEPCLAARLAGAPPYASTSDHINSVVDGVIPPPHAPGAPSPGLATLLGFIPGVGAMYNGQYAKGIVHLIVFAILISLTNDVSGLFGLFIAGWIIYQAIDANHTARARLAGTPLPNPFGLNDLGERLGFGKAWPTAAPYTPSATPHTPSDPATTPPPKYPPYTPSAASWGAPPETYSTYGAPPMSANPPYSTPYPTGDPNLTNPNFMPRHRFPAGAVWLIGLGSFFLLTNTGLFHGFRIHHFLPFLLIGIGVWLFVRCMTNSGGSLSDDGTPMYRYRVLRALRSSLWVTLVGVLFLLQEFHIMSWSRSWPLFIIASGVMIFLQRFAYDRAAYHSYAYPPPAGPVAPTPPTSTSIVPATHSDSPDQERN